MVYDSTEHKKTMSDHWPAMTLSRWNSIKSSNPLGVQFFSFFISIKLKIHICSRIIHIKRLEYRLWNHRSRWREHSDSDSEWSRDSRSQLAPDHRSYCKVIFSTDSNLDKSSKRRWHLTFCNSTLKLSIKSTDESEYRRIYTRQWMTCRCRIYMRVTSRWLCGLCNTIPNS